MRGLTQSNIKQQQQFVPYQQQQPNNGYPFIQDQRFIAQQQGQQFPSSRVPPNRPSSVIIPSR